MADSNTQEATAFECECRAEGIILLPCSGGSNCGQIANQTAVQLTEEGIGTIYCLAGIGAHDSVMKMLEKEIEWLAGIYISFWWQLC